MEVIIHQKLQCLFNIQACIKKIFDIEKSKKKSIKLIWRMSFIRRKGEKQRKLKNVKLCYVFYVIEREYP